MYSSYVDVLIHTDLSSLSIVRGYVNLRSRQFDVCWVYHLPGVNHLPGYVDLRAPGANSFHLQHVRGLRDMRRVDDMQRRHGDVPWQHQLRWPGWLHMSRISHVR